MKTEKRRDLDRQRRKKESKQKEKRKMAGQAGRRPAQVG